MLEPATIEEQLLKFIHEQGIVRSSEVTAHGWTRAYLHRLEKKGLITRVARGLYVADDANLTEHHNLVEIAMRVPHAVISLLSALQFHELGTQLPAEVWIAIHPKDRKPKIDYPPLRVVRFSGDALTKGIEEHEIEGVLVPVFSPGKTVADCFKYRNKIGIDVAIEALKGCLERKLATVDELWKYARICRVEKVMTPYMQALLHEG